MTMGTGGETGVLGGGGKPNIKQIVKKNSQKTSKIGIKKMIFFLLKMV